ASACLAPPVDPRWVFTIEAARRGLVLRGVRRARRLYAESTQSQEGKRGLIVGAGDAGELIIRDMKNNRQHSYCPIGFIDDDPAKLGSRIHGVPVLGTRNDVRRILTDHRPDEVLIATPHAEPAAVRSLVRVFEPFNIP